MLTARSRLAFLENELIHEFYKQREHIYDILRSTKIPFLKAVVIAVYNWKNIQQKFPWSPTKSLFMHTGMLHRHDDEMYLMFEKLGTTREQQMPIF